MTNEPKNNNNGVDVLQQSRENDIKIITTRVQRNGVRQSQQQH